jgi:hypothetical protein
LAIDRLIIILFTGTALLIGVPRIMWRSPSRYGLRSLGLFPFR